MAAPSPVISAGSPSTAARECLSSGMEKKDSSAADASKCGEWSLVNKEKRGGGRRMEVSSKLVASICSTNSEVTTLRQWSSQAIFIGRAQFVNIIPKW